MYKGIETFKDQTEFSNLISDLTKTELEYGIPIEYQNEINSLKKSMHENLISERYQKALVAYKYLSFPFYCEKASDLKINPSFDDQNHVNIADMIKKYSDNLLRLSEEINNEEAQIIDRDFYLQTFEFENDFSFYEWSSLDFPFEISELLNGMKTYFYADVESTEYDALKFCTINFQVKIKSNDSVNQELNEYLNKNFFVELRHSGISNYKFKDKFYVIDLHFNSDKKLLLSYQYGSKSLNNANEAFKKLASNKPILSPFTFWEIQLVPIRKENKIKIFPDISSILKGKHEVTLSMHGIGQFVKNEFTSKTDLKNCKDKRDLNRKLNKCFNNSDYYKMERKTN